MTNPELRAALAELDLTQAAFSEYVGEHIQTISKRCRGALPVPPHYERIIRLLRENKLLRERGNTKTATG